MDDSLSAYTTDESFDVALISSGLVDEGWADVFPNKFKPQLKRVEADDLHLDDTVGFGTFAASSLLQLAPNATVHSLGVYPNGVISPAAHLAALDWLCSDTDTDTDSDASVIDAVVYALPPADILDPITAAMAAKVPGTEFSQWDYVTETMGVDRGAASTGAVENPVDYANLSNDQDRMLENFERVVSSWSTIREEMTCLAGKGLPVFVPAGEIGDAHPQSILGIANLPEVVTVAAADVADGLIATSSAGPSIEGRVKPDLVAPFGLVGLLPSDGSLPYTQALKLSLDSTLVPYEAGFGDQLDTAAGEQIETLNRAVVQTSLSSVIFAAVAGAAAGVLDTATDPAARLKRMRAALTALSVPLAGVQVWKQGAGLLRAAATATFLDTRVLAFGDASFGVEPTAGPWTKTISTSRWSTGSEVASSASVSLVEHLGYTAAASERIATLTASEAPPATSTLTAGVVTLEVPVDDLDMHSGAYCGWTKLVTPLIAGAPTTDAIPDDSEQVATCEVEAVNVVARAFYIHTEPAKDLTFGLFPGLVPGKSVVDMSFAVRAIDPGGVIQPGDLLDPGDPMVYKKITQAPLGHAVMSKVVASYYKVRLWSDYAIDAAEHFASVIVPRELGANPSSQQFQAFVLGHPPTCAKPSYQGKEDFDPKGLRGPGDLLPETIECLRSVLLSEVLPDEVEIQEDSPTGGFLIGAEALGTARPIVNLGFIRSMPGTSVASRYIDLMDCSDFDLLAEGDFSGLGLAELNGELVDLTAATNDGWDCIPDNNRPGTQAMAFSEHAGSEIRVGARKYELNLPQTNYKVRIRLNLKFDITFSTLLIRLQAGPDVCWGAITAAGVVQLYPPMPPDSPLHVEVGPFLGNAYGTAHFDCSMLAYNAPKATLTIMATTLQGLQAGTSTGLVSDLSVETTTWTTERWDAHRNGWNLATPTASPVPSPGVMQPRSTPSPNKIIGHNDGHRFLFSSNFSPRSVVDGSYQGQIDGAQNCRNNVKGKVWIWETPAATTTDPSPTPTPADYDVEETVCEDWSMFIHSPIGNASTFDLATWDPLTPYTPSPSPSATATPTPVADRSLRDQLNAMPTPHPTWTGGYPNAAFHDPPSEERSNFTKTPVNQSLTLGSILGEEENLFVTRGTFWEIITLRLPLLRQNPGVIQSCLQDTVSRLLSHEIVADSTATCADAQNIKSPDKAIPTSATSIDPVVAATATPTLGWRGLDIGAAEPEPKLIPFVPFETDWNFLCIWADKEGNPCPAPL